MTNNSQKLKKCFNPHLNFDEQCNKFFKSLDDILHQCFRKVRVGKTVKNVEVDDLHEQRAKLKISLSTNACKNKQISIKNKLDQVEEKLSNLTSARNQKVVQDHIQNLGAMDGAFCQTGMWRLKSKLLFKDLDPPMAKFDKQGNLISTPKALKELYIDHYVNRLSHRKIGDNYVENYEKKVTLWKMRFERLKMTK